METAQSVRKKKRTYYVLINVCTDWQVVLALKPHTVSQLEIETNEQLLSFKYKCRYSSQSIK